MQDQEGNLHSPGVASCIRPEGLGLEARGRQRWPRATGVSSEDPSLGVQRAPSGRSVHPPALVLQVGPWTGNWGQEDRKG